MKKNKKLIHFLSFVLVNIFLMNTCLQTIAGEISSRHNKISAHQTAKKADTPVVEEDNENENENEEKEEYVAIGDMTFFLHGLLIADHRFEIAGTRIAVCDLPQTRSSLFLKHRTIRI
jgi:hypothetical protein